MQKATLLKIATSHYNEPRPNSCGTNLKPRERAGETKQHQSTLSKMAESCGG
ncbi:hypothetical protein DPMN_027129 [Dreissena polymorpha]|uniref:Uncharacterized protein n=1 Tax=Dreissena polymorpha TaxID=45954 RepID=A0A9D4LTT2_DREPO|nr:hypothetical protein DPMN_027129 [Dreissena polymorpha]